MNGRQRIQTVLEGGIPDRVPVQDSYWATTIKRWRREGLPAAADPTDYFGCEMVRLGGNYSLQLPLRVLEETQEHRLYVDADGATRRQMHEHADGTSQWLDFSIKGRDDWQRYKIHAAYQPSRLDLNLLTACRQARSKGLFVAYSAHACFHPTWHKIGMENLLMWLLEDPELVSDLFAAHTQLIIDMYEACKELGLEFDGAWFSDDLGYRSAPLISPQMYRELVMPHHRRLCQHMAADGLKTILHSDGNVEPLIDDFLAAGFAALHPLEAKAGLDVRRLKPHYGKRLVLFGNIDARQLAATREEIEEEISTKLNAAKTNGGYIYHSDHSVPNDVSLDNYRFALEMVEKYGKYD